MNHESLKLNNNAQSILLTLTSSPLSLVLPSGQILSSELKISQNTQNALQSCLLSKSTETLFTLSNSGSIKSSIQFCETENALQFFAILVADCVPTYLVI